MFKVGDIVEITEESDATGMLDFKKGKAYEVTGATGHTALVRVINEGGRADWYHCTHFKLKEDLKMDSVVEFSIGDVVICIETDFYECDVNNITYRKEYVVERINRGCVQIVKDSGELGWFSSDKFKLKEDTIVEKKECLFKEGQVVWDLIEGRGVVEAFVDDHEEYCVKVRFEDGEWDYYTANGKLHVDDNVRRLFFSEPKIEAATEPLFEPTLKSGDVVIISCFKDRSDTSRFKIGVVEDESEEFIYTEGNDPWDKAGRDFYRLGEKINFK